MHSRRPETRLRDACYGMIGKRIRMSILEPQLRHHCNTASFARSTAVQSVDLNSESKEVQQPMVHSERISTGTGIYAGIGTIILTDFRDYSLM